jgi:hypothetical protein
MRTKDKKIAEKEQLIMDVAVKRDKSICIELIKADAVRQLESRVTGEDLSVFSIAHMAVKHIPKVFNDDDFVDLMERLWSLTHDYHIWERGLTRKELATVLLEFYGY